MKTGLVELSCRSAWPGARMGIRPLIAAMTMVGVVGWSGCASSHSTTEMTAAPTASGPSAQAGGDTTATSGGSAAQATGGTTRGSRSDATGAPEAERVSSAPTRASARPNSPPAPGGGTKPFLFTAGPLVEEPTHRELRTLDLGRKRTITAKVRVEGYTDTPPYLIVPDYSKVALTDEEKKILGEKPEYAELKAFYRMPRGTEHGVSPIDSNVSAGVGGVGGARVGFNLPRTGAQVGRESGIDSHVAALSSHVAAVYSKPTKVAVAGIPWGVQVGTGPARSRAAAAERDD